MVLGEGCGSPGRSRSSTPGPRQGAGPPPDRHPLLTPCPHRARGEGEAAHPTAAAEHWDSFPHILREGEGYRDTLLSVAIVNPNNNNKEKSLQLCAG